MTERWPAWAVERVEVVAPDPAWPVLAAQLIEQLRPRLAPLLAGPIEHVGSTAVAGLRAKPVVDLMAPVTDLGTGPAADAPLAEAGWELVPPELDSRPWRRFYVLPEGARRVAHLQLVERAAPRWAEVIAFRDALRRDPGLARAYAETKAAAAVAHAEDREAYTAAKAEFIASVLGD